MLVHVPDVLDAVELSHCREQLARAHWQDGRCTAGYQSAKAKNNGQLAEDDPLAHELGSVVGAALARNPMIFAAALPRSVYPPLFNCYEGGQAFGLHIDNAIRYDRRREPAIALRTDLVRDPVPERSGQL